MWLPSPIRSVIYPGQNQARFFSPPRRQPLTRCCPGPSSSFRHSQIGDRGRRPLRRSDRQPFRGRPVVECEPAAAVARWPAPTVPGKDHRFYMITGLIAVDYGSIWFDGENITAQPIPARPHGRRLSPQEVFDLPRHDGGRKHHGRGGKRARRQARARRGHRPERTAGRAPARRAGRFALGASGGRRSPARWRASPTSCCWIEPFAASIPWPWPISAMSSPISRARIGILITDHSRARDARHHRSRLHHPRRPGPVRGRAAEIPPTPR